jgi:hypothetical protein
VATAGDVNGDGYADLVAGGFGYAGSTGRLYFHAGNSELGRGVAPHALRADGTAPVAYGGQSESATAFRLTALGHSPFGRSKVKLEWEVKPLGALFDGTGTSRSAAWQNTGIAGFVFNELVSGLSAATPYHWRVRVRYHQADSPFGLYSRWMTQPWAGAEQTRLRTAPAGAAVRSDFTGDLKSDILWRHATQGDLWLWPMDGATTLSKVYIDRVDVGYVVKGVGDVGGDGKADIVWHGAAGDVWVWPMNGTTRLDQVWVGTVPDTGYQIIK